MRIRFCVCSQRIAVDFIPYVVIVRELCSKLKGFQIVHPTPFVPVVSKYQ